MRSTDNYILAWTCWYDSGTEIPTVFNSTKNTLEELPEDGFQAMRIWYSDGTGRFINGNDYYFFQDHPAGLIFGQSNDSYTSIQERYPGALIKRGKHVPDGLMKIIHETMLSSTSPLVNIPVSTPTL